MNEIMIRVEPISGEIRTNFDEIEKRLAEEMRQYEGIVFTEDTKTAAKKTVAELRKLKKSIDDSRKEVKAKWMEPYNQFESRVKQMIAVVERPIQSISSQIEAFEAKRIEERTAVIQQIYGEEIGDLAGFLPLYRIQSEKWLNSGSSVKTVRKEMADAIASARAGKTAIEAMQSDAVPAALRKFQATLNLADAIAYINQCEAQKAEILRQEEERRRMEEERRHLAEIERIRTEERQRVADEERIRREAAKVEEERIRREARESMKEEIKFVDEASAAPLTAPDSHTAVYTVVGTEEELQELEMAMISLGLYYERKDL